MQLVCQVGGCHAGVVLGHYLDVDTTLLQNHKRIGIAAVVIFGIQVWLPVSHQKASGSWWIKPHRQRLVGPGMNTYAAISTATAAHAFGYELDCQIITYTCSVHVRSGHILLSGCNHPAAHGCQVQQGHLLRSLGPAFESWLRAACSNNPPG